MLLIVGWVRKIVTNNLRFVFNRPCAFIYNLHLSAHSFICNCVRGYSIGSAANDHDLINNQQYGGV